QGDLRKIPGDRRRDRPRHHRLLGRPCERRQQEGGRLQVHADAVARTQERLAQALGASMAVYIAKRIVFSALVLVAVSMLVFAITTLLPANVAYLILGPFAPPDQVRALELKLGLTDPIWQQYVRWAGGFLSGNLGESTLMNRPIGPLLMEAVGRSMMLTGASFVLIAVIGVCLGIAAELRHGRLLDN